MPLLAETYVCAAEVAEDARAAGEALATSESLLAALEAGNASRAPDEAARVRATVAYVRAGAALARHDDEEALRLAREAVEVRDAEAAAHRWYEDALFVERLADALARDGKSLDAARLEREAANRLPR